MARLLTWFSSKRGRIFTRSCIGFATFSVFGNYVAFNGPFLDHLKEILQVYSYGKEKLLSTKVQSLVEEVLSESKLKEEEKKKLKFFNVVGHDLFHAGGRNSPWGAIIGVPFTMENIEELNLGDLRLPGHESIDWVVDGQDLLKALKMSDNAKKFGLMREIYSCDFWQILENATIAAMCIIIPAEFARKVNVKRDSFKRFSLKSRLSFYMVCYLGGYILYRCLKDPLKHLSDRDCDRLAAETSPEYLDGGIEFYKKSLLKNKALRELMGARGKWQIDQNGNENYFLLAPRLPISKRLELLRDMKKNMDAKS